MEFELDGSLKEWAKDKPLSVLQLDPADRAVLRIADERDAIQKKTFTKWVNKHLKKANRHVSDLFQDLRNGHNLISLLEVLSSEHLPRETSGSMRFHMLDNVRIALRFLQCKNIKLVNIQAEDIVDGNPKLTLGLIWTIILHFQISDIVVGQESHVSAKEALLRWARKSTARYPGVRVIDFTSSWRDGLAFSAIFHRNRPDLLDWRCARGWLPRERLDRVFHLAEHEYGVTRLLDPEDVDTSEPDEKSLITYISSLYDAFPEPPAIHPLYDAESQRRLGEYRVLANNLQLWMREKISFVQDRHFPQTLIEMKKLLTECTSLKNEEFPVRQRDTHLLAHYYLDLNKYFESVGEVDLEPELQYENLEKIWCKLNSLQQEQEDAIIAEIKNLEHSQRLAEKTFREIKACESRLSELEIRINEESRSQRILERLHPLEAKKAIDLFEQDMRSSEFQIQNIFADIHSLTELKYNQAGDLHRKVQKLHQKWVGLRSLLHKRLVQPLSSLTFPIQEERIITKQRTTVHETRLVETNPPFRALHDCIDWCKKRITQLTETDYGSDLASIENLLENHKLEYQTIEQFEKTIAKCLQTKNGLEGEELDLYCQHLEQLEKLYVELTNISNKRLSDLTIFHDFIKTATNELVWLNNKEELELSRDWSDVNLNLILVEQYYESLMSELEKREIQFSAVQDRGESLVLQHHPASKTVEAYLSAMQSQWAWLLQLTLCLEVHLKHAFQSQQFFKDISQSEQWLFRKDETLNTVYSQSEFSLDDGERLLKGMQELREELNDHGDYVHKLVEQSKSIIPIKQRRQLVTRPLQVIGICDFKQVNMTVEKNETCTLYDNSGRIKWRIKNSQGVESPVPGVCFSMQPPDKEAVDAVEKLKRQYERSVALWQRKQLRLRQNMIFATIKVVKAWTLQQFLDMGQDQRSAIRKALNEDANKLLAEGDSSDPQLRRLKREMLEVNRLFDDFEKRARAEEESRYAGRIFSDQISKLEYALGEVEDLLKARVAALLPFDLNSLEHLIFEHKDFEQSLQSISLDVEQLQQTFRGITLKTPLMKNKLDTIIGRWNYIRNLSNLYIDRLKIIKSFFVSLEENTIIINEFEKKLLSFDVLPTDLVGLQNILEDLMLLQNAISQQQFQIDQLNDDAHNARRLIEKSRPDHRGPHSDIDRLDLEINKLNSRWTDVCRQLVNKLRSAESAYGLAEKYHSSNMNEVDFVEEKLCKLDKFSQISVKDQENEAIKTALNENFKHCYETIEKFSHWLADVENKLAHQDIVQENINDLSIQIDGLQQLKDDIDTHTQPIVVCLDQIRQIIKTARQVLSEEDLTSLEKDGRSLKIRFDKSVDQVDRLLRKLVIAQEELSKFRSETSSFSCWLQKSIEILDIKQSSLNNLNNLLASGEITRDFISDVIAHQADLRFITMAAQKFMDESKEYLEILNDFRTSLPERFSYIEPISLKNSEVRNEVSVLTNKYKDLLSRANSISDRLSAIIHRHQDYQNNLEKAESWIKELEPEVHKFIAEPISLEAKHIEDQLNSTKSLYNEFIFNERLIDNAGASLEILLSTLKNEFTLNETNLLKEPVRALQDKYKQLKDSIVEKCQELDTALVQCRSIQDTLENLLSWLNKAESLFKSQCRPASLHKERLEEQLREQRVLHAEINNYQASIEAVKNIATEFILNSSNASIAKRIDGNLKDIQSRFEKLTDKSYRRGEYLEDISESLHEFQNACLTFDSWYADMIELIESKDYNRLDFNDFQQKINILCNKLEEQRSTYENLIINGKNLISRKEITDVVSVRDKIKAVESLWKQLNNSIDEKQRFCKCRAERFIAYEKLKDQLIDWLNRTENKVHLLQSSVVDLDTIQQKIEDLRPILKEYHDYAFTIERVNDLGMAYDNLIRERSESPSRRRGNNSPMKKPNIFIPLRRTSQDTRSPSPSKSGSIHSPISPGDSSGFSSRRSSQEGFHLDELSTVQQQLAEMNNRYSLLGIRLTDRQTELHNIYEELKKYLENIKMLSQFLDKVQRQLPRDLIPVTKEDADKTIKQIKMNVEEMYEKQSLLDNTKSQIYELIKRKNFIQGIDKLNSEFEDVSCSWKLLSNRCKDRMQFLEDLKEFYDTHKGLCSWLEAKERMLIALGPISSDPRMVTSQIQQVQVLREEYKTHHPQLDHLIRVSDNVLAAVTLNSLDGKNIKSKLDYITKKWKDQLSRLEERAQSLGNAVDTSREFDASLNRLHDALQGISDKLDEIQLEFDLEEQLRKIENLERQLEGQRPLLADAEAAGIQLCSVLSDSSSKTDIQCKFMFVDKFYGNLQKKLDQKKAEVEANLRDERLFEASCSKTLGWLADELGSTSEKLLVSADRKILQQQLDLHEPLYKNVMSKEHEIIMLFNKGSDIIARSQKIENRNLQRDLEKMQLQWDKLKKDALDKHTKLQTCVEHCKKFYNAQNLFLPWLRQAEDKFEKLKPASYKRKDIEKQLKELTSFRNEVWKKSGEFENNISLGETLLSVCDIDKEIVKNELKTIKSRWEGVSNDLLERTQSLEDTARQLIEFHESIRDLDHAVQRCEDKLSSHDAIGGAAKDPKFLDRVKSIREEIIGLKKPSIDVQKQATNLVQAARERGVDATYLQDETDNIIDRIEDLQTKLDDRYSDLQNAAVAISHFNEYHRNLLQELTSLEGELEVMRPSGRDIKTVREQIENMQLLKNKLDKISEKFARLVNCGENLVDAGFATDAAEIREQIELMKKQLLKLDDRVHFRVEELENIFQKLQEFLGIHSEIIKKLDESLEQINKFKLVSSEVDSIKMQQSEFRAFEKTKIEPVRREIESCNSLGQMLTKTAERDVNTTSVEKDLDTMNDKWNCLKEKLNERDRKLDIGLLQSGKFQEALDGLEKWLSDTEDMVAHQKPPSSDHKVVKAQLQEQKFLIKMLVDRQSSISSFYNIGQELANESDDINRLAIEKQINNLMGRFENLSESATQRMNSLERTMSIAKEFQDKVTPLAEWLDKNEKKIREMELIPTDEEKILSSVIEHSRIHDDIILKKNYFSELTDTASILMTLVGEEEASSLADKLQDVTDRYSLLVERSEYVGSLLQRSKQTLRHLVLTYQELQAWIEIMESRVDKYRILAVYTDRILQQLEDLTMISEELSTKQSSLDSTTDAGLELIKHISSDEALQLKEKLDSLQRRYKELLLRGSELFSRAREALPLVQIFHDNHSRLLDWMHIAETIIQAAEPREEEIIRLELEIGDYKSLLDKLNALGPQLSQISPGEGAASIEALVIRCNRRYDTIVEQIQRRAERIQLSKQRSLEVIGDIEELLDWFREADNQLREAEPPSSEPEIVRVQLKEHRALNDDISGQKGRVRDVLSSAKKVLRENRHHEDNATIRNHMEELREKVETVAVLSTERLGCLEQALPLAEHLRDTHLDLVGWLDEAEKQISQLPMPALRPDLIAAQQDRNELLLQSINEHRPLLDKLNKTGEVLIRLTNEEEASKIHEIIDSDNSRYLALRTELRGRQQTLEQALQESALFTDKLEGMLRALGNTNEQLQAQEPVSAHPLKLRDQMEENQALVDELLHRSEALAAVERAANDVINKATNHSDPAVKDIIRKLDRLNKLWAEAQSSTSNRSCSLQQTLVIAEGFWSELSSTMSTLAELQDALVAQAPPAAQPKAIEQQQVALQEIRLEIDQTKPDVEHVRQSGQELMGLCGEPDKPEVRKHIEDLDQVWDNVTALYARREENLIDAMEKAMDFHGTLAELQYFLEEAEKTYNDMKPLGSDIEEVKKQINDLSKFKTQVDPRMVEVETLNRQAVELTERTTSEQAQAIKEPLGAVNRRWDYLLRGIVERQRLLENALLRLGQFQHALDELLLWIVKSESRLNELRVFTGESQLIEVELAKLKVLVNDIQSHQTSVDTLNDAGRQLIEDGRGSAEASTTSEKLNTLNYRWRELLQKAADRQRELEDALQEAQSFAVEIQDLLSWLSELDSTIVASKPVGGLPETASEQLERFMEVYNELENNRAKVETVLQQGKEYSRRASNEVSGGNLNHNLRNLKQRWDNVTARANDKKIKLEIALKEAKEFHDALQIFVNWLVKAEELLSHLKPVSRVMETILSQIEEHKAFQKDVGTHRESMLNLDKKGTHLKYFSQKQDVILIKNLLISVQHRWEKVVSKSAERTRALDHGYKEAREFHDAWTNLITWLEETEKNLDHVAQDALGANDPDKIKSRLQKHREIQKELNTKQNMYDTIIRNGKTLKDKAPKTDELSLREMLNELKKKWSSVCSKSIDRQRRLEEALLYSGQFKEAILVLLDWLRKAQRQLESLGLLHGDLDTVTILTEQHQNFENDLESRALQMDSVSKTGNELESKASAEDALSINQQLTELHSLWSTVTQLSKTKSLLLEEALKNADRLHKEVHILLEWLSDAEIRLRFANQLPDDELESKTQLIEHEKFLQDLEAKEIEKDATLELAYTILSKSHPDGVNILKHLITVIQSRWEEVASWANQRNQKLENHMQALQDLDNLLEELLKWLNGLESSLLALESESLPEDRTSLEMLISDHKEFMENTTKRQDEVDQVCKARQMKPTKDVRKIMKNKSSIRSSPGRDKTPDPSLPHIGPRFPPKGSKGAEPEFRIPRVKSLWDKWRNVWMLAWERQRRLQDRLNYINELDRVANFSWEEWRKKFLKFMNHKKSRLTDLFRKMDKNNDGLIPREDFIQGILNTKFDSSRLEMGAVSDLFDRHGEGLIDWKEFIAALRPDWEERRNHDNDKIHDEVKRLVMLCTCRQKFRVFQVGEGKYRFGDSQKLRLVRILRSTVMVRVGGGWVALDEFLLKNDPCRAKGRTNIELREQFILADGVSQTMTAFRSKPNLTSSFLRTQLSSAGPITKVRERSVRSVPMGQLKILRASTNTVTSDSLSDNESSFPNLNRKSSMPSRNSLTPGNSRSSSRPASRPSSKPSSRYGSTQSLDSTDDSTTISRIPRRTGTPSTSRRNSLSSKKLTSASNGSNSRPRTPTGLISPSTGVTSRLITLSRASSIPTLSTSGSSVKTKIQPGGSTISTLSKKTFDPSITSVESNILRKVKPSTIDQRAPFRL